MKGIMTCKTPYLVEKFKNVDGSDFSAFGLVTIFREKSINLEKEKKSFKFNYLGTVRNTTQLLSLL